MIDRFSDSFDELSAELGRALLASYLLALDQPIRTEGANVVDFADPVQTSFDLPPREAIDYFRSKKVVRREEFDDLNSQARSAAFTVGGIYRKDVLGAFKEEIAQALEQGTPQKAVVKRFREVLDGAGHKELGAFHLETVFRTNMQAAYGTGRRRALETSVDLLPFWTYHAVLDDRTRPAHRALDGLTFAANHQFWDQHFPPWGFNCRCSVTARAGVPAGYNPENPSGEAQLVYNDDGLPAKAEYGTSVIDLGVSRFTGIPLQGRLQQVIEAGAARARLAKQGTMQSVLDAEAATQFRAYEIAHLFDVDGKLIKRFKGTEDKVDIDLTDEEFARAHGGYASHNHPNRERYSQQNPRWRGESFSLEDIGLACFLQLAEVRAITPGYAHSMRMPKLGWNMTFFKQRIAPLYEIVQQEVYDDLDDLLMENQISIDDMLANFTHEIWTRIAKRLGMRYKRDER